MYDRKIANGSVRAFVESCDLMLNIGAMTDFSTGGFTAYLDPEKTINIRHHPTQVGSKVYPEGYYGIALSIPMSANNSCADVICIDPLLDKILQIEK